MEELTSQWELSIIIFSSFLLKVDSAFDILNRSAATEEIRQRSTVSPPEVAHSHRFRKSFLIIYALDNRGRKTLKCSLSFSSSTSRFCRSFIESSLKTKSPNSSRAPAAPIITLEARWSAAIWRKTDTGHVLERPLIELPLYATAALHSQPAQHSVAGVEWEGHHGPRSTGEAMSEWEAGVGWGGVRRGGVQLFIPTHLEVARKPWDSRLQLKHFTVLLGSQRAVSLLWAVEQYLKSAFHLSL